MYRLLKYSVFILISSILLYFAFRDQNLSEIVYKLGGIEYKYIIISIFFGALAGYLPARKAAKIKTNQRT